MHRPKNYLLSAISEAEFARLSPDLVTVAVSPRHHFYRQGDRIDYVYFPNGGVVSITVGMSDGTLIETATVGIEGMVGIEALMGPDATSPGDVMMQVPDTSVERLSADALRREIGRGERMSVLFGRYSQAVIALMMQSAACNALHQVHERCARWLLMTHDRVGRDEFELSHDFLASMLAVRRSSVTVVAGSLQAAGVISYRHARVTILDRDGLEAASCECYAVMRDRYQSLQVV